MIQSSLFKKALVAFSVVTLTATVGVFGTQALAESSRHQHDNDEQAYSKDQCKHDGWKKFKNPDGSMKFKNQGQCIKFFNHEDKKEDRAEHKDNHDGDKDHNDGDHGNDDHGGKK